MSPKSEGWPGGIVTDSQRTDRWLRIYGVEKTALSGSDCSVPTSTRRKLIFVLVLANCVLGANLLAHIVDSQIIPLGIVNCCKGVGSDAYCCKHCCWWDPGCVDDRGCREH